MSRQTTAAVAIAVVAMFTLPAPITTAQGQRGGGAATATDPAGYNIRVEVAITDTLGLGESTKKSVWMLIRSGQSGQVRSTGREGGIINIDARPAVRSDGRISLVLTLEYLPELTAQQVNQGARLGMLTEALTVIVPDGKPIQVSESSAPRSDRKVTVDVTASVVKD